MQIRYTRHSTQTKLLIKTNPYNIKNIKFKHPIKLKLTVTVITTCRKTSNIWLQLPYSYEETNKVLSHMSGVLVKTCLSSAC